MQPMGGSANYWRYVVLCTLAAAVFLITGGCAAHSRHRRVPLSPFDHVEQLLEKGVIDSARQRLTVLRDSLAGTELGARAQYALAKLNVFSKNPTPDWSAALSEFRRYMSEYPNHEYVEEAHAWVRLLSEFESLRTSARIRAEREQELMRTEMLLKQMGGNEGLGAVIGTLQRCMAERDSLVARVRLMEDVIRSIEQAR